MADGDGKRAMRAEHFTDDFAWSLYNECMDTCRFNPAYFVLLLAAACTGSIGDATNGNPGLGTPDGPGAPNDPDGPGVISPELNPEVGVSDLRRVNDREYRNIVSDVIGVELPVGLEVPSDELNGEGFDTDGATLSMGGRAAELYVDAAEAIAVEVRRTVRIEVFAHCDGLDHAELWSCFEPELRGWLAPLFRQPVSDATVDRLVAIGSEIDVEYGSAIETLVVFALTSPYFLIHYKTPDGASRADDFEVAGRLASLLWSSAPDAELLAAATRGDLDEAALGAHADRMLQDPRAERFLSNFARLWIDVNGLANRSGSAEEETLYADMLTETRLFLMDVFRGGDLAELLQADWTYVNRRLAEHYDLPTEGLGEEFVRVALPAERQGLLTHASVLTHLSPTGHSDPIRRGFWAAGRLVCNPPPLGIEPPSNIVPLERTAEDMTVREVLAEHRENPYCASCHDYTDPYGLALETFDLNGAFRPVYESGRDVDPSGELSTGESFADVYELADVLTTRGDVQRCASRYLTGYALGRGLTGGDMENARAGLESYIAESGVSRDALTLKDLVVRLVQSGQFRNEEGGE